MIGAIELKECKQDAADPIIQISRMLRSWEYELVCYEVRRCHQS